MKCSTCARLFETLHQAQAKSTLVVKAYYNQAKGSHLIEVLLF